MEVRTSGGVEDRIQEGGRTGRWLYKGTKGGKKGQRPGTGGADRGTSGNENKGYKAVGQTDTRAHCTDLKLPLLLCLPLRPCILPSLPPSLPACLFACQCAWSPSGQVHGCCRSSSEGDGHGSHCGIPAGRRGHIRRPRAHHGRGQGDGWKDELEGGGWAGGERGEEICVTVLYCLP